ncbi:class I SAM-dependent methyltransferase [Microbispora corallina]|uniref:Methyltransferase n=1 Tax=Microbispora corallina TaxID=83302 RepID=A0ABQ4FXK8_9ACTN|nr:class I SAM-dependent methyltransferase [Microbispora corallina]GIH39551.1 methyltransferase [Microbispora corallina]
MPTYDVAREWVERWDRQQEGYLPDREERFTALIDAVEAGVGRPDPLVIDLGCGPGSLSARLLDRLPRATVVAVDTDPLLLALGRSAYGRLENLRFADLDLRVPGWSDALGLDRPADAAVSTTALHWLPEPELRRVYGELATVLRPGGLFLNGDHLISGDATPTLARLEVAVHEREERRRFAQGRPEDWRQWWDAVTADPALADLTRARGGRTAAAGHHGSESGHLSTHVNALRDAGFGEIGTLWQRGHDRLLCAVRP